MPRPGDRLLGRLREPQQRALPSVAVPGQELGRPHEARGVGVVAAGVHDRDVPALRVLRHHLAGVGQAGLLPHRQGVHVGPEGHDRPVAVAQRPDDPRPADATGHLVARASQAVGDDPCGPVLLRRQLGMPVQVDVAVDEVGDELVQRAQDAARTDLGVAHDPPSWPRRGTSHRRQCDTTRTMNVVVAPVAMEMPVGSTWSPSPPGALPDPACRRSARTAPSVRRGLRTEAPVPTARRGSALAC